MNMVLWRVIAFGTNCLETSMQMLFSIINLPNINLGQLQIYFDGLHLKGQAAYYSGIGR